MENPANQKTQKRFILAISLTSLILVAEILGGIWSGSLALLSDAAHVFADIFALGLSYFALRLATRPPDDRHSYGWQRAEVIAAFINGASLVVIAIAIWVEAVKRWQSPVEIKSLEMMVIAIIGLVVNAVVAFILGRHNHEHPGKGTREPTTRNLNVHSAFLHVIGDLISSIGVIIAALLIRLTSAQWLDPLISILIGGIILVSAYRVLRGSLHILVEGVPEGLSVREIKQSISSLEEVEAVHDLHVWSLGEESIALSTHVVLPAEQFALQQQVMEHIKQLLADEYGITHATLQFEESPCVDDQGRCN